MGEVLKKVFVVGEPVEVNSGRYDVCDNYVKKASKEGVDNFLKENNIEMSIEKIQEEVDNIVVSVMKNYGEKGVNIKYLNKEKIKEEELAKYLKNELEIDLKELRKAGKNAYDRKDAEIKEQNKKACSANSGPRVGLRLDENLNKEKEVINVIINDVKCIAEDLLKNPNENNKVIIDDTAFNTAAQMLIRNEAEYSEDFLNQDSLISLTKKCIKLKVNGGGYLSVLKEFKEILPDNLYNKTKFYIFYDGFFVDTCDKNISKFLNKGVENIKIVGTGFSDNDSIFLKKTFVEN